MPDRRSFATARDYEGLLAEMRALIPERLPEWTGHANEADFGNVLLELFAHMGDILGYYQDRVAAESLLGTARSRRSVIQHLRLIGYELRTASPASTRLQVSVPKDVTSTIVVRRGQSFATRSRRGTPSVQFEYTDRSPLTIDFSTIEPASGAGRKVFDGIPVEEGRLIAGEVLGLSDGRADQRFPLSQPGLILRPGNARDLEIMLVPPPEPPEPPWELRDTLAFSQGGQRHFTVEIDADDRAVVVFGDGNFGAIPDRGVRMSAEYRVGGGVAGNVGAAEVNTIINAPELSVNGARVTNAIAGTGGAEREDIAHAVRHAPAVFRSMRRAVTAADYEALALTFNGVGKVRAVSGGWNEVVLHVAPEGGGEVSDVLEAGLLGHLEDKRMLNQVVTVSTVTYQPVLLAAEIGVETRFLRADVEEQVRQAVSALLAFDRVDFGQTVYLSRFYEAIQETPGVLYATITEFRRADRAGLPGEPLVEPRGKIEFAPFELPVPAADPHHAGGIRLQSTSGGRPER
ncbi:baseplate J/gp47 family protein [Nonomuraea wenchangensis]